MLSPQLTRIDYSPPLPLTELCPHLCQYLRSTGSCPNPRLSFPSPPSCSPPILFGMRLAHEVCTPSPLDGGRAGWGERRVIEVTLAFTPTLTLPRRGGGDPVESSSQDVYRRVLSFPYPCQPARGKKCVNLSRPEKERGYTSRPTPSFNPRRRGSQVGLPSWRFRLKSAGH
jgi:hypothetical protein